VFNIVHVIFLYLHGAQLLKILHCFSSNRAHGPCSVSAFENLSSSLLFYPENENYCFVIK